MHKTDPSTRRPRPPVGPPLIRWPLAPAKLDQLADIELQHGHHLAAERLARRAAEMREAGR